MKKVILICSKHLDKEEFLNLLYKRKIDIELVFFDIEDWNHELAPWTFNEFGNGANCTLKKLREQFDLKNSYLVGYSLAGLFCLWASYQCEIKGIGCCSASLWYQDFLSFMENPCLAKKVYFSLGKKEKKSRHPLMQTIETKTEQAYSIVCEQNICCTFELNNGNHFFEVNERLIKAIEWLREE